MTFLFVPKKIWSCHIGLDFWPTLKNVSLYTTFEPKEIKHISYYFSLLFIIIQKGVGEGNRFAHEEILRPWCRFPSVFGGDTSINPKNITMIPEIFSRQIFTEILVNVVCTLSCYWALFSQGNYTNLYRVLCPPLKKEGILLCTCRSVCWYPLTLCNW